MNKGQGAVTDALFFMLICSISATLMLYVSSIYGQSINQQISAIYNYEYTGNALVSLKSAENYGFWNGLRDKVLTQGKGEMTNYIDSHSGVWDKVEESSPTNNTFLCFSGSMCAGTPPYCYPNSGSSQYQGENEREFREKNSISYTSSTRLEAGCEAILKVYY